MTQIAPVAASPLERRLSLSERAVPRYTSYPTAPQFHAGITADVYAGWLKALPPDMPLSLYLHVPFCAEMCHYCGCHTKVSRKQEPVDRYRRHLVEEIALIGAIAGKHPVTHIHWGGGTPSMIGAEGFHAVYAALEAAFDMAPLTEHAVELDPRLLTPEIADALSDIRVNRASFGVQDFNETVQKAIGRVQPLSVVSAAVALMRERGIDSINLDLMYGLPHQSAATIAETLDTALGLAPDRIALFGYAHVPWFKTHQKLIPEQALPGAAERLRQAEGAQEWLAAKGFVAIGFDHFAHHDDEMAKALKAGTLKRNFQGYTTDNAPALIGLGASSIGKLPQGYVQNSPDFGGYARAIDEGRPATARGIALSDDDRLRADVIERLMCDHVVDLAAIATAHGEQGSYFSADMPALQPLAAEGLLTVAGHVVTMTEEGRPFVRLAAAVFDKYLTTAARHSVAV